MSESMRERLERIKHKGSSVRMPLSNDDLDPQPMKKLLTPESVYMKKIDKLIHNLAGLKKKMHADSGSYLSLYYDLKKAEKELLEAIEDPEKQFMDLPEIWVQKIEDLKLKIKNK
jgi:hypothetical protein